MKYLIDSDIAVDHLSGRIWATDLITSLLDSGAAISLMTYAELYEGVLYGRRSAFAEIVFLEFLRWVKVLGFDEPTMQRFAAIRGYLRRRGLTLGDADLLVATTALHHDLTLVTRNFKHFSRIDDLKLYEIDQAPR